MRVTILSLLILSSLLLVSCDKEHCEKKICTLEESTVCNDTRFDDKDNIPDHYIDEYGNKIHVEVEKHILSPLVKEGECGYIVSGKIKYVVDCHPVAIVDYGDGTVDAWAVKTIFKKDDDGDHDHHYKGKGKHRPEVECCKFEQKCDKITAAPSVQTKQAVNH